MLHIRDQVNVFQAYDDVLAILDGYKDQLVNIIVHCFSANQEYAEKFLAIGAYLEIGGAVTFKNAKVLQEVTKTIPLEKLLIETDAPYLTPTPYRGKINFSKFLPLTVAKIAELKNISLGEVIAKTTENSLKIFTKKIK
jgi:TatD DNase family protein